ncbi:MAG: hypothetical protein JNM61_00080 [Zoogloeaceae bacterium]|nr:hypothetical protein [Zoogloeaceae bacterium]
METSPLRHEPDHAGAIAHALARLHRELPTTLSYHTPWHTEGDVLPAARRLAALAGVTGMPLHLLEVGAAFHDLGYIHTFHGHEILSVNEMAAILPSFGFDDAAIGVVAGIIMATRMPQTPTSALEALMADADLDVLGRDDFLLTSTALWREQAALGHAVPWQDWLRSQSRFLQNHHFFTPQAQALRQAGQDANHALLTAMIEAGTPPDLAPPVV